MLYIRYIFQPRPWHFSTVIQIVAWFIPLCGNAGDVLWAPQYRGSAIIYIFKVIVEDRPLHACACISREHWLNVLWVGIHFNNSFKAVVKAWLLFVYKYIQLLNLRRMTLQVQGLNRLKPHIILIMLSFYIPLSPFVSRHSECCSIKFIQAQALSMLIHEQHI